MRSHVVAGILARRRCLIDIRGSTREADAELRKQFGAARAGDPSVRRRIIR
jgi:hypothetical protein